MPTLRAGGAASHDGGAKWAVAGAETKAYLSVAALHVLLRQTLDPDHAAVRDGEQRFEAAVLLPAGPHLQPRDVLPRWGCTS